jgi:hypothetical protein
MAEDRIVVQRVAWRELCPWLMIFRCFRLSISLQLLFLASIGVLLMPVGDFVASTIFGAPESPFVDAPASLGEWPDGSLPPFRLPGVNVPLGEWLWREGPTQVYWFFVEPVWRLFDRHASMGEFLRNAWLAIWRIAVWSLLGGAIVRVAVVQLGRDERVSLPDSLRHALRNWGWYLAAPLFPLGGVALLLLPYALFGLLMRADVFALLASIAWPLLLLGGLFMAMLLLGLLAGWPLMWPTISAEQDSDAFEAFNRSYSYSFQRPLQYLFYALIALAFGQLCWLLVENFANAVMALNHWALSFGAGNERVSEMVGGSAEEPSTALWAGSRLIGWWDGLVRRIAIAFKFSFFFCAASAIYLLLRREVDQTDFDEVYVPEGPASYALPEMRPGPEGVPEVVDPSPDALARADS